MYKIVKIYKRRSVPNVHFLHSLHQILSNDRAGVITCFLRLEITSAPPGSLEAQRSPSHEHLCQRQAVQQWTETQNHWLGQFQWLWSQWPVRILCIVRFFCCSRRLKPWEAPISAPVETISRNGHARASKSQRKLRRPWFLQHGALVRELRSLIQHWGEIVDITLYTYFL